MAVILTVTTNPENFSSGTWPASVMNTGIWRVTFTPSAASGPTYAGFGGLFAQSTGGIWIANSALEMYTSPGDALVFSRAMTWSAGQALTFTINVPATTVTIAGATTGNGTFSFSGAPTGPYFNASDGLRAGGAFGVSGFGLPGVISNIDDTNTGSTFSRAAQATAATAIASASGVRAFTRALAATAAAAVAIGSSAVSFTRTASATAATSITSASGQRMVRRSAACSAVSSIAITPPGAFGLGDYGAARALFGAPAGFVSTTLDTATTGSTILICVGGNLGDLVTLPTDNRGNTWSTVGTDEYARWPGYGIKLYQCVGATGGAGHTFSQQFGQTAGFDECTITVVEIKGAAWVQSSSLVERGIAASLTTGAVSSVTDCSWVVFFSGDAPTGATAVLTPNNGLSIIDDSTGIDHPNGYVPIVVMHASKGAGTHQSTVGITPSQGAIIGAFAVQAMRVEARGASATGVVSVSVASGQRGRVRSAAMSALGSVAASRGVLLALRSSQMSAQSAVAIASGIVLPPGGTLIERESSASALLAASVARGQRGQLRGAAAAAATAFQISRGVVGYVRSVSTSAETTLRVGAAVLRSSRANYTSTGVIAMAASLVVGDLEPDLILQCLEPSGVDGGIQAIDLTGVIGVTLRIRRPDGTLVIRAAAVEDAARGLVRYVWTVDDTSQVGMHRGHVVIMWGNGETQTVPSNGSWYTWTINQPV